MTLLSILIPSTTDRKSMTDKLFHYLMAQVLYDQFDNEVEILVDMDNKQVSIGAKRQRMIENAKGEYVVQIDSDDWVSIDYVKTILKALEEKPDCIGHQIACSGTKGKTESVSIQYEKWADWKNGYDYVRTPYPKTPIKRSICLLIGYKDLRFGEDHDFSLRLKQSGFIQSEKYIPQVLYFYRYKYASHDLKYGIKPQTRIRSWNRK